MFPEPTVFLSPGLKHCEDLVTTSGHRLGLITSIRLLLAEPVIALQVCLLMPAERTVRLTTNFHA